MPSGTDIVIITSSPPSDHFGLCRAIILIPLYVLHVKKVQINMDCNEKRPQVCSHASGFMRMN